MAVSGSVSASKISLCMIVKDEESFLPACLESARGAADEIVVVDTGSADSTVAIAEKFGARVIERSWQDDFAAARNQALAASSGEWILALDADERLDGKAGSAIREAVGDGDWDIGLLHFVNMNGGRPCGREWLSCRLYRRTPAMRYIGRIHEQMVQGLAETRTRVIDATVYHYGYEPAVFAEKQKRARNARLVELALAEAEAQGPLMRSHYLYHYANLASDQELLRRYEQFASFVRREWPEALPQAPWILAGLAEYARLLNDVGRYADSAKTAGELLGRWGESPMLRYLHARALAAAGDFAAAEAELHAALREPPVISDDHRHYSQDLALVRGRARFLLGLIREKQERLEEAVFLYQAAVEEEPDQDIFRGRLACALARLGRYREAVETLEGSGALVSLPHPPVDCLGFVLGVLVQSVARLAIWGEKLRQAAPDYPPAAAILRRVEQLGPGWRYRMEDFPEMALGLALAEEPGAFEMPQTTRKSSVMPPPNSP